MSDGGTKEAPSHLVVTSTGFSGAARASLRAAVGKLPQLEYRGDLVKGVTDVLICSDGETCRVSQKVLKAMEWQTPLVSMAWLRQCAEKKMAVPVHPFLLMPSGLSTQEQQSAQASTRHDRPWATSEDLCSSIGPLGTSHSGCAWNEQPETWRAHHECAEEGTSLRHIDGEPASPNQGTRNDEWSRRCLLPPAPVPSSPALSHKEAFELSLEAPLCTEGDLSPAISALAIDHDGTSVEAEGSPTNGVRVCASKQLRGQPRLSSALAQHGLQSPSSLLFYRELEVVHEEATFCFNIADDTHCALVYYEDADGGAHELAYINIINIYKLPGGQIFLEHGYLFDRDDLAKYETGRRLLEEVQLDENELVWGLGVYHSPATVVEGEFWLSYSRRQLDRARAVPGGEDKLLLFATRTWDQKTGKLVAQRSKQRARARASQASTRRGHTRITM